ncbi:MAG: hypothetical protein IPH03_08360 [Tetrasphaera sp.]|nr:hypothetical protein [Tetrasphaera sp.]
MPDVDEIHDACDQVQAQVGRPINPTILTPEEATADSGFLTQVRASPTALLFGELPW